MAKESETLNILTLAEDKLVDMLSLVDARMKEITKVPYGVRPIEGKDAQAVEALRQSQERGETWL